ncbi:hypothetical protein GZ77_10290 [Endozoicomonas montiporae]|uniref:DUF1499 domain-containing protein n=1 Tax=Endozoicomonas montiporae TaxID=1027273 RepID=A0A081N8C0_9GAMM|nr:hypothetical protein GZ77_10290 [Endozoicomonas montiporae]
MGQPSAKEQALLSCPDKPNCVSSLFTTGQHAINPLNLQGQSTVAIRTRLLNWLHKQPGATVVEEDKTVLKAEFRSRVFGFIDDLILIIEPDGRVDVSSASRTGYYDFGVNRKRVEALRASLHTTTDQ